MSRVFLSYVFEDRSFRDQVLDWSAKQLLGAREFVIEAEDVRQHGDSAVYAHLRSKMRTADGLLVLVGQDAHNRLWMDSEIHYFATSKRPIIATRLPHTTGGLPREIRNHALVTFNPDALRQALSAAFDPR